ncbi:hypothetical protein [Methylobacterium radiotolerans]|uniref:hypothetical protein n=1 Tax=Methylobacterium radiotolerans TaxID=31998 RepID=UPI0038D1E385
MTTPRLPIPTETVCVEFYADVPSRAGGRGWRVPMAVEASAPRDAAAAIPTLAVCTLRGSYDELDEDRTTYLDSGGRVLVQLRDPHGHLEAARSKLPPAARALPYFRRQHIEQGHIPSRHHAIDGEAVRTYPHLAYMPLDGGLQLAGGEDLVLAPIAQAAAHARELAASCLLLRPEGWFTAGALPHWSVYVYGNRKALLLTERAHASIGNTFAVDRYREAADHAERVYGPGFETIGAIHELAPERIPLFENDLVKLACRLGNHAALYLSDQVVDMDGELVQSWHEAANARALLAAEGMSAAYRVIASCERLLGDALWTKTQRHERSWLPEIARVRTELEAADAPRQPGPAAP